MLGSRAGREHRETLGGGKATNERLINPHPKGPHSSLALIYDIKIKAPSILCIHTQSIPDNNNLTTISFDLPGAQHSKAKCWATPLQSVTDLTSGCTFDFVQMVSSCDSVSSCGSVSLRFCDSRAHMSARLSASVGCMYFLLKSLAQETQRATTTDSSTPIFDRDPHGWGALINASKYSHLRMQTLTFYAFYEDRDEKLNLLVFRFCDV
ncbi:uncharacterized protein LACBIDRAFT_328310 [Laccaria bicolor S238N-H82]|uniref:Predicted protein n=1 Tax=Laccaria bicolor (strain S238N-H82 / ATCC MYA-4686) TaxID=486041 RepID=B0DEH7_LACBS|nr:uncharacterized protein LACBIDRAFT_328310 [Laccaria bicolor S238N-H82]EDR07035.1 predicted protein [Laccaria bicolor S238N-H82]|eukprot:XP_001882408.1 predicted protein [Laccaria bicolor S238N-H82]